MTEASNRFYHGVYYPLRIVLGIAHPRMKVHGRENVPDGPCILAANHVGMADPFWVIFGYHPDKLFHSMAKVELFRIPVVRWFISKLGAFPVDRDGGDVNAIKNAMRILRSGEQLMIFPEGTRVKEGRQVEAKYGVALLAARMDVPIVPIYLSQKRRPFSTMHIVYGEPYRIRNATRKPTQEELEQHTHEMMQRIYRQGENYEPSHC